MTGSEEKKKVTTWKQTVKFLISLLTTIFLIVATTSGSWAILKNEKTDKEVARFGIWRACMKPNNKSGDETCSNFFDGNFKVYKFGNDPIDIDFGSTVDSLCYYYQNVTTEFQNKNYTTPKKFSRCKIEELFDEKELERVRVFSILVSVVAFLITFVWAFGFFKPEMSGFTPAGIGLVIPLWHIIAIAVFTAAYGDRFNLVDFQYSWSFSLAWLAAILSIFHVMFAFYHAFTD